MVVDFFLSFTPLDSRLNSVPKIAEEEEDSTPFSFVINYHISFVVFISGNKSTFDLLGPNFGQFQSSSSSLHSHCLSLPSIPVWVHSLAPSLNKNSTLTLSVFVVNLFSAQLSSTSSTSSLYTTWLLYLCWLDSGSQMELSWGVGEQKLCSWENKLWCCLFCWLLGGWRSNDIHLRPGPTGMSFWRFHASFFLIRTWKYKTCVFESADNTSKRWKLQHLFLWLWAQDAVDKPHQLNKWTKVTVVGTGLEYVLIV